MLSGLAAGRAARHINQELELALATLHLGEISEQIGLERQTISKIGFALMRILPAVSTVRSTCATKVNFDA